MGESSSINEYSITRVWIIKFFLLLAILKVGEAWGLMNFELLLHISKKE